MLMLMDEKPRRFSWSLVIVAGGALVLGLAWLLPGPQERGNTAAEPTAVISLRALSEVAGTARRTDAGHATPQEIVDSKMRQFARNRRGVVEALAERFKAPVPAEVQRFFDAAEKGDWDELKAAYEAVKALRETEGGYDRIRHVWAAVLETWGVAETAHEWPAQRLLEYGDAVLGSLRPGMVYVGGTDPGRFIPTLMNETEGGEHHVVLTQNAFADSSYLDYVRFLYEDRLAIPSGEDSQRAFQDYLADAQKRLQHDMQFPDEPKQIRPGEDVRMSENRVQVSGQVAVMAINERLLQNFLSLNPGISFALEESFPLQSTYADALPLGPIMELNGKDSQNTYSAERVAQTLDYWKNTASQLLADSSLEPDSKARQAYAKMAAAQAALLADHQFQAEAEQAYRLAMELAPESPEAAFRLAKLLADMGRTDEARELVNKFNQQRH
jgi:tetratricopeptide (TPR) repeat protein